jgi:hypothetical protein
VEGDVQKLSGDFPVFESLGDHPKGESLNPCHGFVTVGSVAQDASQIRDFRQPPAVAFTFKFDRKNHAGTVASGPAVQQPLGAVAPKSLCNRGGPARGSSGNVACVNNGEITVSRLS